MHKCNDNSLHESILTHAICHVNYVCLYIYIYRRYACAHTYAETDRQRATWLDAEEKARDTDDVERMITKDIVCIALVLGLRMV